MLSTASTGDPAPAQSSPPSGRPPDTSPDRAGATVGLAADTTSTEMLIDVATTNHQPCSSPAPAQQFSYAKALTGWKGTPASPAGDSQWTPVGVNDLIPGDRNGEPALMVSSDFRNKICAPWQRTLVVRLLGLRIGFPTLCSRLRSLWKPAGNMEILDLDHACFLVKLDNEQDYFRALTDGPWVIFDHYLAVQQWTPQFKVSDPLPKKMIVWVQLPALKIHFYHKEVLISLGNLIGRTIKLDYHTLNRQRAKFARLAVEVDMAKHLVPRIWLDDAWQKVEYENLPAVCFECGKIGHSASECPLIHPTPVATTLAIAGPPGTTEAVEQVADDPNPGFGPWMLVSRKSRRNFRDHEKKGKTDTEARNQIQGNQINSGKAGNSNKERTAVPPSIVPPAKITAQRVSSQEGKVANGKKKGEEGKKGKAVLISEPTSGEAGLLGPGPSRSPKTSPLPKTPSDPSRASSSAHPPLETHPNGSMDPPRENRDIVMAAPPQPTFQTVVGPNGTVMQIVEITPSADPHHGRSLHESPSTAARIKKNKKQKDQKLRSPIKFPPMKSLQIGTPKKDRKPRSKSRIATLTLQEINAWNSSAKSSIEEAGEKLSLLHTEGQQPTPSTGGGTPTPTA
ncbi:unnamed protein product [Linum trigynum]|uniref:CCHC-type domain-containing protein n=1 Tax=Linum trigynum TaxID=586398 RepID=A0AAV2DFD2_9ROSI